MLQKLIQRILASKLRGMLKGKKSYLNAADTPRARSARSRLPTTWRCRSMRLQRGRP